MPRVGRCSSTVPGRPGWAEARPTIVRGRAPPIGYDTPSSLLTTSDLVPTITATAVQAALDASQDVLDRYRARPQFFTPDQQQDWNRAMTARSVARSQMATLGDAPIEQAPPALAAAQEALFRMMLVLGHALRIAQSWDPIWGERGAGFAAWRGTVELLGACYAVPPRQQAVGAACPVARARRAVAQ